MYVENLRHFLRKLPDFLDLLTEFVSIIFSLEQRRHLNYVFSVSILKVPRLILSKLCACYIFLNYFQEFKKYSIVCRKKKIKLLTINKDLLILMELVFPWVYDSNLSDSPFSYENIYEKGYLCFRPYLK